MTGVLVKTNPKAKFCKQNCCEQKFVQDKTVHKKGGKEYHAARKQKTLQMQTAYQINRHLLSTFKFTHFFQKKFHGIL